MSTGLIIAIVAAVILLMMLVGIYNKLVAAKNHFKNAFAQIDVQLKRRYDLIPNLVDTVKGYMSHERETLDAVISARNTALSAAKAAGLNPGDPSAMKSLGGAESMLSGALGKLNVVMEAYPDLKADKSVGQLMEELTSTENRIAFSRQSFNDSVMAYNITREKFPNVMIAGMCGFTIANQLEIEFEPGGRDAPKVQF